MQNFNTSLGECFALVYHMSANGFSFQQLHLHHLFLDRTVSDHEPITPKLCWSHPDWHRSHQTMTSIMWLIMSDMWLITRLIMWLITWLIYESAPGILRLCATASSTFLILVCVQEKTLVLIRFPVKFVEEFTTYGQKQLHYTI